jgi:hypothetical protein
MFVIPTTAMEAASNFPTMIKTSSPVKVIDEKVAIDGIAKRRISLISGIINNLFSSF